MHDSIKKQTVSNVLKEGIAGRKVMDAVFTSFTLEVNFFELEVIPELLSDTYQFSLTESMKRYELDHIWSKSPINVDVFYDKYAFNFEHPPLLECNYIPVSIPPKAFHPKITVLLLEDSTILVMVGSNNLSYSGWWENIETINLFELTEEDCPVNLKTQVLGALEYLEGKHSSATNLSAVVKIKEHLKSIKETEPKNEFNFYFQTPSTQEGPHQFIKFLKKYLPGEKCKGIQVISPFFENDANASLIKLFMEDFTPESGLSLYLPVDLSTKPHVAFVSEEFYKNVADISGVYWSELEKSEHEKLKNLDENQYRKVHAKVFLFEYEDFDWIFIGSVNFSNNAFAYNAEAGCLIKLKGKVSPILQNVVPVGLEFSEENIEESGGLANKSTDGEPNIYALYDWKNKELLINHDRPGSLSITFPEMFTVDIASKNSAVTVLNKKEQKHFETALGNLSIFQVAITDDFQGSVSIIVNQKNTIQRPENTFDLSIEQLIQFYSGLGMELQLKKIATQLLNSRRMKELGFDQYQSQENSSTETENFFSEFTEINSAFFHLSEKMKADEGVRDYYLLGKKADSLQGILGALSISENSSAVTKYLILISALEILKNYKQECTELYESIQNELVSQRKELTSNFESEFHSKRGVDADAFFDWFEGEFMEAPK